MHLSQLKAAFIVILASGCSSSIGDLHHPDPWTRISERVSIYRDSQGVAHVFGGSEVSAYYGLGYATAQDRLFQMRTRS